MSDRLARTRSSYSPARGGHAPADLRAAFLEGIGYQIERPTCGDPAVGFRDGVIRLSALCSLLLNCSDTLPMAAFAELELLSDPPADRSYAAVARWLRERMRP